MIKRTAPHPVGSDFINRVCARARGLRRRGHEEGQHEKRRDEKELGRYWKARLRPGRVRRTPSTAIRYPLELVQCMRGHGRRKVMFGTNYPMITAAKALEGLDDLGLDADAKASFLGGNAARVFRINQ